MQPGLFAAPRCVIEDGFNNSDSMYGIGVSAYFGKSSFATVSFIPMAGKNPLFETYL